MPEFELLKQKHNDIFGEDPELIVHAPGRVNLIGEHTDYSKGFVMPMAIDMGITVAISKIPDSNLISVYSLDFDKKMVAMYSDLVKSNVDWFNYPIGVVKVLQKKGYKFEGIRITFTGNVPQGAGLSSSAALEVGVAFAIQKIYNLEISGTEMALICQQAEHEVVGVKCGIMDQYICRMGAVNQAMLIDCQSLEYRLIPLDLGNYKMIITNSNVPHKLSSSLYNQRVSECEEAVKILSEEKPGKFLRDYTEEDYKKSHDIFPPEIRKRAFHVISENQRVLDAEKALQSHDLTAFGNLMNASHKSLEIYYEVSSVELDWLVEAAQTIEGCIGSRMTGAGFGGCTISILTPEALKIYLEKLPAYEEKFGYKPITYEVTPVEGVHEIWKK
ncbi:galactokinase [Candidatus Lokiarchaeum ossiferum]|uniref:galactokinase n=1 Tax=Candidatus Lokiarchaeum ossiferum TaxID=2951803 RepID=UPI00352FABF7